MLRPCFSSAARAAMVATVRASSSLLPSVIPSTRFVVAPSDVAGAASASSVVGTVGIGAAPSSARRSR